MKKYIVYLIAGGSIVIESIYPPHVIQEQNPEIAFITEWHEPELKSGHPIEESNIPLVNGILVYGQISGRPVTGKVVDGVIHFNRFL